MATNENGTEAAPNAADFAAVGGLTSQNYEEFEQALEELFDKADDLLINQQRYDEAVSKIILVNRVYRKLYIIKFWRWIMRTSML